MMAFLLNCLEGLEGRERTQWKGGVRKVWKTCSDTFFIAVFSYRFNETGENTRAVREVTNFSDSPVLQGIKPESNTF